MHASKAYVYLPASLIQVDSHHSPMSTTAYRTRPHVTLYLSGQRHIAESPSLPGQYGGEGETAYFSFRVNVGARTVL